MKRTMSVAGSFYPVREAELERYFEHFNQLIEDNSVDVELQSRVVIVPHAGYVYSGYTANLAYRVLHNSKIKKFVVIGPSHKLAFDGVSVCDFSEYETPFGEIYSAEDIVRRVKESFSLSCLVHAHAEHSTEVQFPFIKYYMGEVKIVELVYGSTDAKYLSKIIEFVLEDEDCGVIISTDLSHFHDLDEAEKLDANCVEALKNLDLEKMSGCEACGIVGVEAMMISANKLSLNPHILDYRTSADASGDKSRVVGYMSACFV